MLQKVMVTRPFLTSIGLLMVAFIAGTGFGLFLGTAPAPSEPVDKYGSPLHSGFFTSAEAQERVEANTLLSSRIRELEQELDDKKEEHGAIVLEDRLALFKKYASKYLFSAFNNDLKITPEMADILELSEQEQKNVESHLSEEALEMEKLVKSMMVQIKRTANSVTYEIPVDPKGAEIKAKFDRLIQQDIGEDRADFFLKSCAYGSTTVFCDFTRSKRDIEITQTLEYGRTFYTITDRYKSDHSEGSSGSHWPDTLPPEYQALLQGNANP